MKYYRAIHNIPRRVIKTEYISGAHVLIICAFVIKSRSLSVADSIDGASSDLAVSDTSGAWES